MIKTLHRWFCSDYLTDGTYLIIRDSKKYKEEVCEYCHCKGNCHYKPKKIKISVII